MRLAILISGRGTNLQALLGAMEDGSLGGQIVTVLADREAEGLTHARRYGIPAVVLPMTGRDEALLAHLRQERAQGIVLAGYLRILSPAVVESYRDRILNVHPSLLPAFPGLRAQRQALQYGVRVTGVTVHLVDEGLDSGPIVLQQAVAVQAGDTEQSLAARLRPVEHQLLVQATHALCMGRLRREGRIVNVEGSDD